MNNTERLLVLRLARGRYALRGADVSGVAEPGWLRAVPLAPSGVLGLTEWRGRLLTVLDLPRLLGDDPLDSPASLLRLAAPLEHTALFVPGPVQLLKPAGEESASGAGSGEAVMVDGQSCRLLDPAAIVSRLERQTIAGAARRGDVA